jgi:GH18 family chitinase
MTETEFALAMITKAGVPSNKVVVGVSSYGRAFQMTAKGCTGPMCTYTEPESRATPRKYTATAGFCCFSLLSCQYYLAQGSWLTRGGHDLGSTHYYNDLYCVDNTSFTEPRRIHRALLLKFYL